MCPYLFEARSQVILLVCIGFQLLFRELPRNLLLGFSIGCSCRAGFQPAYSNFSQRQTKITSYEVRTIRKTLHRNVHMDIGRTIVSTIPVKILGGFETRPYRLERITGLFFFYDDKW